MKDNPVSSFVDNIYINSNTMVAAHQCDVQNSLVSLPPVVYPQIDLPFVGSENLGRVSEPVNGGYAISKQMMMEMGAAYAKQYGFCSSFPILARPIRCGRSHQ